MAELYRTLIYWEPSAKNIKKLQYGATEAWVPNGSNMFQYLQHVAILRGTTRKSRAISADSEHARSTRCCPRTCSDSEKASKD